MSKRHPAGGLRKKMTPVVAPVALVVSATMCAAVRWFMLRIVLLDEPGERSSHQVATPRGGGIGVIAGTLCGAAADWQLTGRAGASLLIAALGCGLIGLVDDVLRGVSARLRLVLLVIVIGVAMSAALEGLAGPVAWRILFAVCCVTSGVAYVNVFNFMDGINGISVAETVVAGCSFFLLGRHYGSLVIQEASVVATAAALGFLPFNFPRARLFLGDVGSYFLGACIVMLALLVLRRGAPVEAALGPLVLSLADSGSTLLRRIRRGAQWDAAHREHVYQRLAMLWGHPRTTTLVFTITAVCAALGAASIQFDVPLRVGADCAAVALIAAYLMLPGRLERARSAPAASLA